MNDRRQSQTPSAHGYRYERRMMQHGNELKVRAADDGGMVIEGYSIVFESKSVPMGWFEEFEEVVSRDVEIEYADGDVFSLFNHDWSQVLGRMSAGTMTVKRDDKGLWSETQLADNERNRMLAQSIERGDIRGQSFGFELLRETWDEKAGTGGIPLASLEHIRLHETTVTPIPAYPATDIEVQAARSRFAVFDERRAAELADEEGRRNLQYAKARTAFMGARNE